MGGYLSRINDKTNMAIVNIKYTIESLENSSKFSYAVARTRKRALFSIFYFLFDIRAQRGFTLLIASLIGSILLTLAIFMINIAQKEVLLSTLGRDSQYAFYAADAGAECALYLDFRQAFDPNSATHIPQCSGQVVGEYVSSISADSGDLVTGGQGYDVPSVITFDQANRCVIVEVTKSQINGADRTRIHSRGYNLPCSVTESPRRLERAIEMRY
jgi:hypothetical protein